MSAAPTAQQARGWHSQREKFAWQHRKPKGAGHAAACLANPQVPAQCKEPKHKRVSAQLTLPSALHSHTIDPSSPALTGGQLVDGHAEAEKGVAKGHEHSDEGGPGGGVKVGQLLARRGGQEAEVNAPKSRKAAWLIGRPQLAHLAQEELHAAKGNAEHPVLALVAVACGLRLRGAQAVSGLLAVTSEAPEAFA